MPKPINKLFLCVGGGGKQEGRGGWARVKNLFTKNPNLKKKKKKYFLRGGGGGGGVCVYVLGGGG